MIREGQLQSGELNVKLRNEVSERAEMWPEAELSQDELSVHSHVLAMAGRQREETDFKTSLHDHVPDNQYGNSN